MNLAWSVALIVVGTLASAAIGVGLAGSPWGALAGAPTAIVGIWQAWRGHKHEQAMLSEIAELKAWTRPKTPSETMLEDREAMARQARLRAHATGRPRGVGDSPDR